MTNVKTWTDILGKAEYAVPLELQSATLWLLDNIELVNQLLKVSHMPEDVRQNCMRQAKAKHEHHLWILLMYQKFIQEHTSPNEFPE